MYAPTEADLLAIDEWFAAYDALADRGAIEEMADLAVFPMNLASDVDGGHAAVATWSREQYVAAMREAMPGGTGDLGLESTRTPHFVSENLVVVITEAAFGPDDDRQSMRYADLLVRTVDGWAFQTMVQGGWAHGWTPAQRG